MRFINLLLLLFLSFNVFGQAVNPNDTLKIGKKTSSSDKGIVFETNDGVSNKTLKVNPTSKKLIWSGNDLQIGDGASANAKELVIDPASGASIKWSGSTNYVEVKNDKVKIGEDANSDITLEFGKGGSNPAIKYDSVKGKLAFSNDGSLYKDIGSGTGGGSGGFSSLSNSGFEDGINVNWSNTGGTFTQESYTNDTDDNLKYARFIASGSGQYFESDLYVVPDFLTGSCIAYLGKYKVAESSHNAFKLAIRDGSNEINSVLLASTNNQWLDYSLPVAINCPTGGSSYKLRIESLSAGTIEVDEAYLGSDNRLVNTLCQGTTSCQDIFSAKVSSVGVVSGETLDWINGNCSIASTSQYTCTFNANIFTVAPNCVVSVAGSNRTGALLNPTTNTQVTVETGIADTSGFSAVAQHFELHCQKSGADFATAKPQMAVSNSASAWFIDANIGGANISLGTTSLTTYTEITNGSLDMVLNSGSAVAEIPCSSTNPSTGLTCSAGNESLGVAFNPPFSGYFDVCANTTQYSTVSSNSQTILQLIETPNNAQTILQEGKQRNSIGGSTVAGNDIYHNADTCGTFYFSDTSKKTIRLMYEFAFSSGSAPQIYADRSASAGQRDIRVTVKPSTRNIPAPVLMGENVTTKGIQNPKLFSFYRSGSGVVSREIGDLINGNCTNANPSVCTFNANTLSVGNYVCQATSSDQNRSCYLTYISTGVNIQAFADTGADFTTTVGCSVTCHGY